MESKLAWIVRAVGVRLRRGRQRLTVSKVIDSDKDVLAQYRWRVVNRR